MEENVYDSGMIILNIDYAALSFIRHVNLYI